MCINMCDTLLIKSEKSKAAVPHGYRMIYQINGIANVVANKRSGVTTSAAEGRAYVRGMVITLSFTCRLRIPATELSQWTCDRLTMHFHRLK